MNVEQEFNNLFVKDAGTINATLLNAPSTILDWIQENFTPKVSLFEAPVSQTERTPPRWLDVKENPPHELRKYWVTDGNVVTMSIFTGKSFDIDHRNGVNREWVKQYMWIIEPPLPSRTVSEVRC